MKSRNVQQQFIVWSIGTLAILGFTIGLFLTFAPAEPRYTYWVAVGDLMAMEVALAAYSKYSVFASTKKVTTKFPVAMHISIENTIGLFFLLSVIIVLVFLLLNRAGLDLAFAWIVAGKWLLMILAISLMYSAGQEGIEDVDTLRQSREKKNRMLNTLQQSLTQLRRLPTSSEDPAPLRQVTDELETLRNQVSSWVSSRPASDEQSKYLDNLLEQIASAVNELGASPRLEDKLLLPRIQDAVRRMSGELRHPVIGTKA